MANTDALGGTALEWDLGDRLHKALRIADLNVSEISAALGISRTTATKYLAGEVTRPKPAILMAWAMKTGVPYEWLRGSDLDPAVTCRLREAA